MKKTADRPPLVRFLLAFAGLIAVALSLAALSPAPERRGDDAPASRERRMTVDDPSATRTGRDTSADRR